MIHQLEKAEYSVVRPLFAPLEAYQPMCRAVLEGIYPGRVFVDEPGQPRTALLCSTLPAGGAAWCFLAGNAVNAATNQALNQAIMNGHVASSEVDAFLFTCHPEEWQGRLEVVFRPRPPVPMRRRHYVCREISHEGRAQLPGGFDLEPLDPALLHRSNLQVPSDVRETLTTWQSVTDRRMQDCGFVAIHGYEVVAWATVDFVAGGTGDIGFFTLEPYRRRGLATVVATAALEHGLAQGLSQVSWTCSEGNHGSIRMAEKLGCVLERGYSTYMLALDPTQSLVQEAYAHLQAERYQEAADAYERLLFRMSDPPDWVHYEAAQAQAALANHEKALAHLHAAVDQGWCSAAALVGTAEFESLHGRPEWTALLNRIRRG